MVGQATQGVVVTEEIFTETMKEVSVFEDFPDLLLLAARTDSVEERIDLSGGVTRRFDGCGRVRRMDNHGVLN